MQRASKRWLIFTFLSSLALGAGPAFAQAPATQQPPPPPQRAASTGPHEGFGIQLGGGPIFNKLADATNVDSKTGWLVGLLMGGNRGGTVGVEADVLYGEKGVSVHIPGTAAVDFTQHVVHVPVMLKINGGSGNVNGVSVFGVGGGFFDWQFNSKLGSVDISNDTDGYEVGWVVGAGVEALRFSIQGRFTRGVRQIGKNFDVARSVKSDSQAVVVLFAFRLN